jgi:hypothetical protein
MTIDDVSMLSDSTAPQTTITSSPAGGIAKSLTVPIGFTSSETPSTFSCKVDTGAAASCTSPKSITVTPGVHTFSVAATDGALNTDATPATVTFTAYDCPTLNAAVAKALVKVAKAKKALKKAKKSGNAVKIAKAKKKLKKAKKSSYMLRKLAKDLDVTKEEVENMLKTVQAAGRKVKMLEEEYGYTSRALHDLVHDIRRNQFLADRAKSERRATHPKDHVAASTP